MGLLDFFSQESGQKRSQWLRDNADEVAQGLNYLLGPTGIPDRIGAVNELLNPVVGMGDAMTASGEMMAPGKTPAERAQAGLRAATEVAGVVAPAAGARVLSKGAAALPMSTRAAEPAAATVDTLTGGLLGMPGPIGPGEALKGAGQDLKATGQAILDRASQPGQMPTVGSMGGNMFDTFDYPLVKTWFNKIKDEPGVWGNALDNVLKNQGFDTGGDAMKFLQDHGLVDAETGQLLDPNAGSITISPPPPGMLEAAKKADAENTLKNAYEGWMTGGDTVGLSKAVQQAYPQFKQSPESDFLLVDPDTGAMKHPADVVEINGLTDEKGYWVGSQPQAPGPLEQETGVSFDDLLNLDDDFLTDVDFTPEFDPLFTPSAGESLHMAGIPPSVLADVKKAFDLPENLKLDEQGLNDLFADAKIASFDKGDLSDYTAKFLKNNIHYQNGKATFAGPIYGKAKNTYDGAPKVDYGKGPTEISPVSNLPGWVKEDILKQSDLGFVNNTTVTPEEFNDLLTTGVKGGKFEGDLKDWADEYLALGQDANGNVKAFINQTAVDDIFDGSHNIEDNPFTSKDKWKTKHSPPAPTYTWQNMYDHLYEQEMKSAMEAGDPYGPTSWDEVKEKLLQDESFIDDIVTNEVDNYYKPDWIPEQLQEDFITGKEMTDDEIIDLLSQSDMDEVAGQLGIEPDSLDKADLWYQPDPGQLAFPDIGGVPEGPTEAGQELIDEFKQTMGEMYFDPEGKLDDVGEFKGAWGQFDPDDWDTLDGLADYYGVNEMAKEGIDDMLYDDDQIAHFAETFLGGEFNDEAFQNNLLANYAKNGQMDDDYVMQMMQDMGFDDDYDALLPEGAAEQFGLTGANMSAPGAGEGTTFKRLTGGTDIEELLDAAATASPGSRAFQNLMDYAAPRTDDIPANEQALASDINTALMARIGNLQDAQQQGYDLDLPLYHGGKQRFYQPEVRNLGAVYTATSPSGARAGAYGKGTPYMHPMVFRGNVFGRGDLPEGLNERLVQDLSANAQKADPEQSREVLKQSLLDWSAGTDDALTENEAEMVSNQLLTTYFSEGGDVPGLSRPKAGAEITARDAAARKAQHSPGTRYPNNLPGYSYAESGSYGSSQGAYQRALMKLGFDAAPVRDEVVGNYPTERSISVFRPEMLRSPLAKFDRNRQDENNLFASIPAAGLLGLLALAENQRQEQKTDPSLLGGGL